MWLNVVQLFVSQFFFVFTLSTPSFTPVISYCLRTLQNLQLRIQPIHALKHCSLTRITVRVTTFILKVESLGCELERTTDTLVPNREFITNFTILWAWLLVVYFNGFKFCLHHVWYHWLWYASYQCNTSSSFTFLRHLIPNFLIIAILLVHSS